MQILRLRLLGHLSGAWKFRWYGLVVAAAICLAGWVGVAFMPNSYEASAKVYIDTDTLLKPLLRGLAVTTDTEQEVRVMLRTLFTGPNLERVIRATNPQAASMSGSQMQDAITSLRSHVSLENLGPKNLYSISYTSRDPAYAKAVAQALVSVLIDSNIGSLRRDSDSVRNFLDNQISEYEQKLEQADKRRADFKSAHLNFFVASPTGDSIQVGSNVVVARDAVRQAKAALDEATARRDSLRNQLTSTRSTMDVSAPSQAGAGSGSLQAQLDAARVRLSALRTRFTDDYPDVVHERNLIARLKAEIASGADATSGGPMQGISNPAYVAIRSKLADEEANVAVAREKLAEAQKNLEAAKQTALEAITVQRQYEDLDRDYQVLHKNYEELVARRESANISQAAGSQQSAVFQVVEPPREPERPSAPNRLLLNAFVLLAAIGVGGAIAIAMSEYTGRVFVASQLAEALGLPVIGSVTAVHSAMELAQQRRDTLRFAAGFALILVGYLVVLYMFHGQGLAGGGGV